MRFLALFCALTLTVSTVKADTEQLTGTLFEFANNVYEVGKELKAFRLAHTSADQGIKQLVSGNVWFTPLANEVFCPDSSNTKNTYACESSKIKPDYWIEQLNIKANAIYKLSQENPRIEDLQTKFRELDESYIKSLIVIYTYIQKSRDVYLFEKPKTQDGLVIDMPDKFRPGFYADLQELNVRTQDMMNLMKHLRTNAAFNFFSSFGGYQLDAPWEEVYGRYFHSGDDARTFPYAEEHKALDVGLYFLPLVPVSPNIFKETNGGLDLSDPTTNDMAIVLREYAKTLEDEDIKKALEYILDKGTGGRINRLTPTAPKEGELLDPFEDNEEDDFVLGEDAEEVEEESEEETDEEEDTIVDPFAQDETE